MITAVFILVMTLSSLATGALFTGSAKTDVVANVEKHPIVIITVRKSETIFLPSLFSPNTHDIFACLLQNIKTDWIIIGFRIGFPYNNLKPFWIFKDIYWL